jgi:hypothetical protein
MRTEEDRCPTCEGRYWNTRTCEWVRYRVTTMLVCETCGWDYMNGEKDAIVSSPDESGGRAQ